jgi:hypothetical protein
MSLGARPALAERIGGLGIMDGVDQTGRIVGGQVDGGRPVGRMP